MGAPLVGGWAQYDLAYGGGIYVSGGLVRNTLVISNRVYSSFAKNCQGGGVYMTGGAALENVTVFTNRLQTAASPTGAGIYRNGGTVTNAIIYGNQASTDGGTSWFDQNVNVVAGFVYSCAPELSSGTGNITADPRLRRQPPTPYALGPGSPCINAGTNQAWMLSSSDLGGNPRIIGGTADMGAYEAALVGTLFLVH